MCLWAIYSQDRSAYSAAGKCVDPWSWEYIINSQTHQCGNWYCGREIPFLEIIVTNFRYCVFAVYWPDDCRICCSLCYQPGHCRTCCSLCYHTILRKGIHKWGFRCSVAERAGGSKVNRSVAVRLAAGPISRAADFKLELCLAIYSWNILYACSNIQYQSVL